MSVDGGEVGAAPLTAARDAPLGGQAVLEGVMMRGVSTWAVAVRQAADPAGGGGGGSAPAAPGPGASPALGEISVSTAPIIPWSRRHRLLRLPVIRGVVALVE